MCRKKYSIAHAGVPTIPKMTARSTFPLTSELWIQKDTKAIVKLSIDQSSDARGIERKQAVTVESSS